VERAFCKRYRVFHTGIYFTALLFARLKDSCWPQFRIAGLKVANIKPALLYGCKKSVLCSQEKQRFRISEEEGNTCRKDRSIKKGMEKITYS
jgi:hypothetical protein